MKSYGDKSRAVVKVDWFMRNRGHLFIAENQDDVIYFVDPQTGSLDAAWYFRYINPHSVIVMRTDQTNFTELVNLCLDWQRKGGKGCNGYRNVLVRMPALHRTRANTPNGMMPWRSSLKRRKHGWRKCRRPSRRNRRSGKWWRVSWRCYGVCRSRWITLTRQPGMSW